MAFATHWRVTFGGDLSTNGGGSFGEIWSSNVNGRGFIVDPNAWLANRGPALRAWFTLAANHMRQDAAIRYMKLNEIGPDGKYTDPFHPHTIAWNNADFDRGPDYATYPSFVAPAVSWRTSRYRGPGSHGRIYIPSAAPAFSNGSDYISDAGRLALATTGKALLTLLNTAVGTDRLFPVVASGVDASLTDITSVTVGNVLDVQRRRKNKAVETYSTLAFP